MQKLLDLCMQKTQFSWLNLDIFCVSWQMPAYKQSNSKVTGQSKRGNWKNEMATNQRQARKLNSSSTDDKENWRGSNTETYKIINGIGQITFTTLKRTQCSYLIYQATHSEKTQYISDSVGGQMNT